MHKLIEIRLLLNILTMQALLWQLKNSCRWNLSKIVFKLLLFLIIELPVGDLSSTVVLEEATMNMGIRKPDHSVFSMVYKRLVCTMVRISNGIWKPNHYPDKMSGFKMVRFLYGKDHPWPFENLTIWNHISKKSRFQLFPDFEWLDFRSLL